MRAPSQHASAGRYVAPPYTPPYITVTPEITVSTLRPNVDEFLIMATDGVWDFLSSQEAVDIAGAALRGSVSAGGHEAGGSPKAAVDAIKREVLERAAKRCGLTRTELENLPPGRERRRRHDDITVVVVDLKRAREMFVWG